jgi:hypothetical protein
MTIRFIEYPHLLGGCTTSQPRLISSFDRRRQSKMNGQPEFAECQSSEAIGASHEDTQPELRSG